MGFKELAHVFPDFTRINTQGCLVLGGVSATDLVLDYGTPLYVFCEKTLRGRCRSFKNAFTSRYPNSEILYASKAYIGPKVARIFDEEGLGLDIVSGGELAVARTVNFPPAKIFFHGNNKTADELQAALEYGVGRIVVDSIYELELLDRLAAGRGIIQPILLRLTPGVDPHTHSHTTTGVLDSKFGIPITTGQAGTAVELAVNSGNLDLMGLHFHLGSPIFELEPYVTAIGVVLQFASEQRPHGLNLQELSPGGGFAIPYTRSQRAPSPNEYAEVIVGAVQTGCESYGLPIPKLILEPGRAIIGPAGVALYSVGSIKSIPGMRTYAAVDGGMGDNIRPALYNAEYEAVVANKMLEEPKNTYTIAGKFCESGDILVNKAVLPELLSGDIIALPASGAYNTSMASNYNLNPRPPIVMVNDSTATLVRRRETYEDLLNSDIL